MSCAVNKSLRTGLTISGLAACVALFPAAGRGGVEAGGAPRRRDSLMREADRLAGENRPKEAGIIAAEAFKEAEQANDTASVAAILGRMAEFARDRGDARQVFAILQKLENLKPKSFAVDLKSAETALLAHKLPEARTWIGLALFEKPDDPDALLTLARIAQEDDSVDEAIRAYERIIAIRPKDYQALTDLSHILRMQGKFREAARLGAQAREADPERIDAYIQESYAHLQVGEYGASEKLLSQARARHPKDLEAYHHLATSYLARGDMAMAEMYAKKAIELIRPDDKWHLARTYFLLSSVYQLQNKLTEAEQASEKAFELAPHDKVLWVVVSRQLIDVYDAQHQTQKAMSLSAKMLDFCKASPCEGMSHVELLVSISRFKADQGDTSEAKQLVAEALELYNRNPGGIENFGALIASDFLPTSFAEVCVRLGEYAEAEEILRKVLSERSHAADDDNSLPLAWTMKDLAALYVHENRNAEAEPLYRKALAILKNFPNSKAETAAVMSALDGLHKK